VVGTIQQIDLVIQSVEDEAEHDPSSPRLNSLILAQARRSGLISALQIADQEGKITFGMPDVSPREKVSDRDFFLHLKEVSDGSLYLSRPFQDGPNHTWTLALARRLNQKDGRFGGVVFACLPLDHLSRIMARVNIGRLGSVSLRGPDLSLLARYPGYLGQETMIGNRELTGDYLTAIRTGLPAIQFRASSTIDGTNRIYALQRTEDFGFFIFVGLAESEALGTWKHQAAFATLAVLGFAALTLTIGWQSRSAWLRHLAYEAKLAAEEGKYRLLAENALDVIWSLSPDGKLTYISPSILRQRGWTPEEFKELDFREKALSKDEASRMRERMARISSLEPGSQPFEQDPFETTVRRKDGREIQVEARWRIVWSPKGQALGFQGVTRDVTERKRLEAERDALIQELTQALAEVKALSGLLPICSHCKKVRDDQGYWSQIESYLSAHTEATFTHGICPDCAQRFREEIETRRKERADPDEHQAPPLTPDQHRPPDPQ
jgi:PAS domain S-box-containing protein